MNEVMVPKTKQEWNKHDRRKVQLNARTIYFLRCIIDRNEYHCVYQCKSTKEIWRLLEVTHEGTNKVED